MPILQVRLQNQNPLSVKVDSMPTDICLDFSNPDKTYHSVAILNAVCDALMVSETRADNRRVMEHTRSCLAIYNTIVQHGYARNSALDIICITLHDVYERVGCYTSHKKRRRFFKNLLSSIYGQQYSISQILLVLDAMDNSSMVFGHLTLTAKSDCVADYHEDTVGKDPDYSTVLVYLFTKLCDVMESHAFADVDKRRKKRAQIDEISGLIKVWKPIVDSYAKQ